jgi:hypothetical protein
VTVLLLFAGSLVLKHAAAGHLPSAASFSCATIGLILGGASGWLGGELVNRLGIGVSANVGLDAPSSLSDDG